MSENYAARLENKLVTEFKEKFFDKLGYEPIVITRMNIDGSKDTLPRLTLEELESCFDPFLPERFGKPLRLGARCRKRELVELRNIFCALARMMRYTFVDIGKHLGDRDHTTVIHNVSTFHALVAHEEMFQEKYKRILTHIKYLYEPSDMEQPDQAYFEPEPALLP